jgi:hypothetical protein
MAFFWATTACVAAGTAFLSFFVAAFSAGWNIESLYTSFTQDLILTPLLLLMNSLKNDAAKVGALLCWPTTLALFRGPSLGLVDRVETRVGTLHYRDSGHGAGACTDRLHHRGEHLGRCRCS